MAAPAKFLFNADFAPSAEAAGSLTPAEITAKLAEAETNGFCKGFAAAEKEITASSAHVNAVALERIAGGIDKLANALGALEARLESEVIEVALAVARKLANELIAREPTAEIVSLANQCFGQLVARPHVVVRVNEALHATARDQIDALARQRGFEGRLVVLGEPEIALGDCRIEWADGGVTRDQASTDAAIANLVQRYVAARHPHNTTESGDPQ